MGEFMGRWVLVGVVVGALMWAMMMATTGSAGGPMSLDDCGVAGVFVGFWNACLRPLVLRFGLFRFGGRRFLGRWEGVWSLGLWTVVLNGLLLGTMRWWLPVGLAGVGRELFAGSSVWAGWGWVFVVSGWSWLLGAFFRGHDGVWHSIGYHGRVRGGGR